MHEVVYIEILQKSFLLARHYCDDFGASSVGKLRSEISYNARRPIDQNSFRTFPI